MEELREHFEEWRETFESKGMRVNLGTIKLMVKGMEKETFDSNIDPCGMCEIRVMPISMLCTACGKWVHARCTDKKKVAVYLNKNFVCKKYRRMVKNFKGPDEILHDCGNCKLILQRALIPLTYSSKVHLRANFTTWHCQVWHVLSFSDISLPVLFDYVYLEHFVIKIFKF